jgi:hypothetical protein
MGRRLGQWAYSLAMEKPWEQRAGPDWPAKKKLYDTPAESCVNGPLVLPRTGWFVATLANKPDFSIRMRWSRHFV